MGQVSCSSAICQISPVSWTPTRWGGARLRHLLLFLLDGFLLSFPLSQVAALPSHSDWEERVSITASYSEHSWVEAPLSRVPGPCAQCCGHWRILGPLLCGPFGVRVLWQGWCPRHRGWFLQGNRTARRPDGVSPEYCHSGRLSRDLFLLFAL